MATPSIQLSLVTGSFGAEAPLDDGIGVTSLPVNEAEGNRNDNEERNLLYNSHFSIIHGRPPS